MNAGKRICKTCRTMLVAVMCGMAATGVGAGDAAGSGLEVRHSPACLTDAGEISSSPVDTARYGVIFPMQIDADVVALFVNRGAYLGRVSGVERWNYDFEDGSDVFLTGRVNDKIAVSRSSKEGERFVTRYPLNGGFVPTGALLSGRPHPHAGSGFLINLAYSHEIAKDGTFDWRTPGFRRLVEVRQARYDGTTLTVAPPATYDADRPLAIGTDGWCVHASGMSVAIPDGEDLLFPLSATDAKNVRKAVGLARWRRDNGVWAPVSFSPIAFNDGTREHSYTEPSVVRDAVGRLVFAARDDGRRDRSGAKPRTAYEQDLNAWISDDSGKSWRVLVHAEKMRTPGPMAVGRTSDGRIFLAANPIPPPAPGRRDYRGKLVLWPVADDGRLGESITICDANTEFGKNGAYWCVDHPTSTILQDAGGVVRSVLAYRVRDPYFYPFRPGNVFTTPSKQSGSYLDEVRSTGPVKPIWEFETTK